MLQNKQIIGINTSATYRIIYQAICFLPRYISPATTFNTTIAIKSTITSNDIFYIPLSFFSKFIIILFKKICKFYFRRDTSKREEYGFNPYPRKNRKLGCQLGKAFYILPTA